MGGKKQVHITQEARLINKLIALLNNTRSY